MEKHFLVLSEVTYCRFENQIKSVTNEIVVTASNIKRFFQVFCQDFINQLSL